MSGITFAYFYTMDVSGDHPIRRHRRSAGWLAVLLLTLASGGAQAAELVMFERAGCPWCRNWDREIAPIYPKTPEGARAPLRRVSLDQPLGPAWKLDPPVFYSPTFVVMDDGREIGRITGYSNAESFWGLLSGIMRRIPPAKAGTGATVTAP